ncbi:MAG TPA: galactose ABC transporter substrate-binding protein [Clostridium sp.]
MRLSKKILTFIMFIIMITATLIGSVQKNVMISSNVVSRQIVRVAVPLFKIDDPYMSLVRQSLEKIQKANEGKVEFTFFDGQGNQSLQNELIDSVLQNNFDLLLVNLVTINTSSSTVEKIINKANEKNIPIIFFNIAPDKIDAIKPYKKAIIIASDDKQAGILQGKILVDAWNANKNAIDRNGDNILQYVMLSGPRNNTATTARTLYSVLTINNAGIKTNELSSQTANWDKDLAKNAIESLFLKFGGNIEAIIANNDAMAIGAIEALQKYGYNTGDKTKTILVVGIDAIPEAQDLIRKGFMAGSVLQAPEDLAEALYRVGMNLVDNKNPLEGTGYKFDETGITIKLPYYEYISQ